jgi:hypothetical protein
LRQARKLETINGFTANPTLMRKAGDEEPGIALFRGLDFVS